MDKQLGVIWAVEEEVSKLLDAPFGLSIKLADVETYLYK